MTGCSLLSEWATWHCLKKSALDVRFGLARYVSHLSTAGQSRGLTSGGEAVPLSPKTFEASRGHMGLTKFL
jgi:hypothetical protein